MMKYPYTAVLVDEDNRNAISVTRFEAFSGPEASALAVAIFANYKYVVFLGHNLTLEDDVPVMRPHAFIKHCIEYHNANCPFLASDYGKQSEHYDAFLATNNVIRDYLLKMEVAIEDPDHPLQVKAVETAS